MIQNDFLAVRDRILSEERSRQGIGTLGEKAMHRILKNYIEPDREMQECPIGDFVADIYRENEIVEVQTRNFNVLSRKLDAFLAIAPVTVAHPICVETFLNWVDPDTGEIVERRKSSKKGRIYDVARELIRLKPYLRNPDLHFRLFFLKAEEYRLLDGYGVKGKNHATKMDRIPKELLFEVNLDCPEDYQVLLPQGIPASFTSEDYRKAAHVPISTARAAICILNDMGFLENKGRQGRRKLWIMRIPSPMR